MKLMLVCSAAVLTLSGCAGGNPGPTGVPNNTYSAMWSTKDRADVDQCLARAQLTSAYQTTALNSNKTVYRTLISTSSETLPADRRDAVFACL